MSDKIVNTSVVNDEALALFLHETLKNLAKKIDYDGQEVMLDFDPENSAQTQLLLALAHELNQSVIKPASERAAAYMLRNHHKALFEALPVGDVDAFDILNAVNGHLDNVSAAIRTLDAQGGTTVTEKMEQLNREESK